MIYNNFYQIPLFHYDAILADPPWHFDTYSRRGQEKSPDAKYNTMSISDIQSLPVNQIAKNNCLLMMWCTAPHLQLGFSVIESWGFTYKTCGAWIKTTKNNKVAFGTGYILRSAAEFFLIATIGKPIITSHKVRNAIISLRREHSRKPDEQYTIVEDLNKNGKHIELFSRQIRLGWDCFGNEVGKYQ